MHVNWIDGFTVRVKAVNGETVISANREGLLSLAAQLNELAQQTPGTHIHYDEHNSLEAGSDELIVELVEEGEAGFEIVTP